MLPAIYSRLTKKEQMDKLDETDHPTAFIPKAMINERNWQVFWLTLLFEAFPSPSYGETVAGVSKSLY